ncbi:MAG TPA: hypothetical protein VGR87_16045 [Candidatus Limnocylindria bacterium]|jgi:outer membrane lipoprotein-sorting protein|nr:hypothetical protein [Candidatus Limnocylindria bacterium]
MNDEERFEERIRGIAASVRAPASAYAGLERAAATASERRAERRWRVPVLSAAALVVLALIASLVAGSVPASASDLLARAERVATSGSTNLQSYRGTIKGENWIGDGGTRAAAPVSYEQVIAFGAPNRVRIETTAKEPGGGTGRQVLFFDGNAAWLYVPDAKVAQPIEPRMVLSQSPFAPSTLAGAIEGLSQAFEARQLADDTVLGRAAHVLELGPKSPGKAGPMVAKITTWLDAQTLVQLGADVRDGQGQLLMTWRFVAFEPNAAVAASNFSFTPPAGVRVGQVLPPGASAPLRAQLWAELAAQSPFPLFRPFCGIDGLDEGMPARDERGAVLLPFSANGAPVVVMAQGPRAAFGEVSGEKVTIGDLIATYRLADGVQSLDFDRAGTHVHIRAPQPLGREPLYHLALSLVPVAKP